MVAGPPSLPGRRPFASRARPRLSFLLLYRHLSRRQRFRRPSRLLILPSEPATIKLTDHPELGAILTDPTGRTLYLSTNDERKVSKCSGGCAEAFPPLLTFGDPLAEEGVTEGALGTLDRQDGAMQVTYNGWPLYYFAADAQLGSAMGQDVGDI